MTYEKIWQKILNNDEKIEYEFSIGDRYIKFMLIVWGIISVCFLPILGFGIIIFLIAYFYYAYYLRKSNAYAFTNKRVLQHNGWLSTSLRSIDYSKITDTSVEEPFIDRVLTKTGYLVVKTASTDAVIFKSINEPYEVKKRLDSLKDKH